MKISEQKKRLKELNLTQYQIHKDTSVRKSTLSDYFAERLNKVGKKNFKIIVRWLREHNVILIKKRDTHPCPECGRVHVKKKTKVVPAQYTQ